MPKESKAGRSLTADGFARLLDGLDPDPERAAASYESLRETLVKFFDWRGASFPEENADETLDRVAQRLARGDQLEEVRSFAHGIARRVLLEQWRSPEARLAWVDEAALKNLAAPEPSDEDPVRSCLERCLAELPLDRRELVLQYYTDQGRAKIDNRRRMAQTLGLSDTALRSRAQRVRDRLERCIERCTARQ